MIKKLTGLGLDEATVEQWLREFESPEKEARIPFEKIRPVLGYLKAVMDVNPTRVLKQNIARYESGELKSVSANVYAMVLSLRKRAAKVVASGSRYELERQNEKMYMVCHHMPFQYLAFACPRQFPENLAKVLP